MEVLVGAQEDEEAAIRDFLLGFAVIPISKEIAEVAVRIRRQRRLRLPDSIIWASAQNSGFILVTRNSRDFPIDHPGIRVPYQL